MQIDYTNLIKEYQASEPSTLDGFTEKLADYHEDKQQSSTMVAYTMWRALFGGYIQKEYKDSRDYTKANLSAIMRDFNYSEGYLVAIAGVTDIILKDMWDMYRVETPYVDLDGVAISAEQIIFHPGALTHAFTFKGLYAETFKWEEQGTKSFDECYEIRQTLLGLFLTASRDKIKVYQAEIKQGIIAEENGGEMPITVVDVTMTGDELEKTTVTLEMDSKGFSWLNESLKKKWSIDLLILE